MLYMNRKTEIQVKQMSNNNIYEIWILITSNKFVLSCISELSKT